MNLKKKNQKKKSEILTWTFRVIPIKCIGKKVKLTPTKVNIKMTFSLI